jgi:hypothetical protein
LVGSVDDIGGDQEIIVEEVGRQSIVGVDASHTARAEKNDLRPMRFHPIPNCGLASQVQPASPRIAQQVTRFTAESPHDSASDHSVLAGDPDHLVDEVKEH